MKMPPGNVLKKLIDDQWTSGNIGDAAFNSKWKIRWRGHRWTLEPVYRQRKEPFEETEAGKRYTEIGLLSYRAKRDSIEVEK